MKKVIAILFVLIMLASVSPVKAQSQVTNTDPNMGYGWYCVMTATNYLVNPVYPVESALDCPRPEQYAIYVGPDGVFIAKFFYLPFVSNG